MKLTDVNINEVVYVEYETLDDVIIEPATKVTDRFLLTLKSNKLVEHYLALYPTKEMVMKSANNKKRHWKT